MADSERTRRVSVQWNWWPINRPSIDICDPDDSEIWVGMSWGNGNSDPVWSFSVLLRGLVARPFIAWTGWRWNKTFIKQEARREGVTVKQWKAANVGR